VAKSYWETACLNLALLLVYKRMRIGAFQIDESLPDLRKPHAFAILRPWIDAGAVGSLTINSIEDNFHAYHLGQLVKPGNFFDFTRYRPTIRLEQGRRKVDIPNSHIFYARRPDGNDLVFFHLLEPHMAGEYYAESVLKVLQMLGVEQYSLIGSMYDSVPHTKPLLVSGFTENGIMEELQRLGVQSSKYEGPSTITILTSQEASKHNIASMSLIVHLPQYAQLDEDYLGHLRLLEVLCALYHFPIDLTLIKHNAAKQMEKINQAMKREKQMEQLVEELEILYETRMSTSDENTPKLSPTIEKFLREIDKGF
jgi:predicted ATP-grasp superfamily ATP-dependent carboligase